MIIQIVKQALANISSVGPYYLTLVNDFPATAVMPQSISINLDRKTMSFNVRGYTHNSSIDELIRNIELELQSITNFDYVEITEVSSDEGLMLPYAVCDVKVRVHTSTYMYVSTLAAGKYIQTQNGDFILTQEGLRLIA